MSRKNTIILIVVVVASGGISFVVTRLTAWRASQTEIPLSARWLGSASESVVKLEEDFSTRADTLIESLLAEQNNLGIAIEDPCTPDNAIITQVETVIAAHAQLLREVGGHIAALRSDLPDTQRQRLMTLCADMVRGPLIRAGGQGPGYGGGSRMGPRDGSGAGRRFGGPGAGYGRGRRLGAGLAQSLRLTDEQITVAQQKDPNFETDAAMLRDVLLAERAKLLTAFEDLRASNDELIAQIEKLISAHSQIERRIAQHVLVLRPYLTPDQQKWLIGLCGRTQSPP